MTPDDASRESHIYGPDVAALKGKMHRTAAVPQEPTFKAIPPPHPSRHTIAMLRCALISFFVQGIGFLHTLSRSIGFRTVIPIADRSHKTNFAELLAVINLYRSRGLSVCNHHADNEFECICEIRPVAMNIASANSHLGEVEQSIRTIKERLCACVHGLPFWRLPKLMITHIAANSARCLNQFPRVNGISLTMSPLTIITGAATPDHNAMHLELGTHVQVFGDHAPTNTPRGRFLGAIALCPTGNTQGDYYVLSMSTGARISRHN